MKALILVAIVALVAIAGHRALGTAEPVAVSPTDLTIKHGRNLPVIEANAI